MLYEEGPFYPTKSTTDTHFTAIATSLFRVECPLSRLQEMAPSGSAKDYPFQYLAASAVAAAVNYPLWRASAMGQSGFRPLPGKSTYALAFSPPFKGLMATVLGMTWARAAIFYGSDVGKDYILLLLKQQEPQTTNHSFLATVLPPLLISSLVQVLNMPLVRSTVTLQDPQSPFPNVRSSLLHIYRTHGLAGLWHGTSAGILKTVPKYCTAVYIKDRMELALPQARTEQEYLFRSICKSVVAGVAGAALTNPLDVLRNEMFQTNLSIYRTSQALYRSHGFHWLARGLKPNLIAVAVPVSCTIFLTDMLIHFST